MVDLASPLAGAEHAGFVTVRADGLRGMITLRGDQDNPALALALHQATGCDMPARRRVVGAGGNAVAWMSPDELLVMVPYAQARAITDALSTTLAGEFATVADVSDARAVFTVTGTHAPDMLCKLCPVDFSAFGESEIRRTRAAQVATALWRARAEEYSLVCFRSVAQYMFDLLSNAARPGTGTGLYR